MDLFPAFFGTEDIDVVVMGGGEDARRKIRLLAKTHARIHLVAASVSSDTLNEFDGRIVVHPLSATAKLLKGAKFAIVAFEEDLQQEAGWRMARTYRVPVNVVDRPELCDFTVPSILDRGSVVAGVATGGAAPIIARDIRAKLETLMPKRIGDLARFAKGLRSKVKDRFDDESDRRKFWEGILNGPVADQVLAGDEQAASQSFDEALAAGHVDTGVVHIVGAGPGDPELLTLKAFRLIQAADVVFYDFLVGEGVLDLVRRDADRVCVGKSKGNHSVPQDQIHDLMIAAAREGKRVVRLKGGDPFVFGRGGEELEAVRAAGIPTHVVPGISSALGCAAATGIPLTHRDHAQAVTFVTGHARKGGVPDLDWSALANPRQTVVVFMGVGTSEAIAEHLIHAGRSPETPVAVIENGTRENEIRAFGALHALSNIIQENGVKGPALLVIGDVVKVATANNDELSALVQDTAATLETA